METKYLIALAIIPMATLGATVLACASHRVRDIFFVLLVFLAIITERVDINFISREWYRGTTRGFEISVVDILAISLLVSMFLSPRRGQVRGYWPASLGLMLLFLFWSAISVGISQPKIFGLFELSKIFRGLVVFLAAACFIRSRRELRMLVVALALAACVQGVVAIKMRYIDGYHRVPGLLYDPNSFSMYLCMIAPVFVAAINADYSRALKLLFAAALVLSCVALILTISRTGVVSMAIVLVGVTLASMSYRLTLRKIAIGMVVLIAASGALYKSWDNLTARFKEATIRDEYKKSSGMGRGYYLRVAAEIIKERPLGVGLNNWSWWVTNLYGPRLGWRFVPYHSTRQWPSEDIPPGANIDMPQAAPAHNLGALVLGELGIPGLVLLALLWLRWFQMGAVFLWARPPDPMKRMAVGFLFAAGGIFLQSITEWTYRQSPIFFTFNILLGALAALYGVRQQEKRRELEHAELRHEAIPGQIEQIPRYAEW